MKKLLLLTCTLLALLASSFAQFTYTTLACDGATTVASGINNHGQIAGAYSRHPVLINHGDCVQLSPPLLPRQQPLKSNDRGDVVGQFRGVDGLVHGFLLRKGVVTTLDFPTSDTQSNTAAYDINESGVVVGLWYVSDSDGYPLTMHGFMWSDGNFSQVDFPGAGATYVFGINARGDLVGGWGSDMSDPGHAFVFSQGRFVSFDFPMAGSTGTQGNDINALGHIVGGYVDADGVTHGFLKVGDVFTPIDFPGAPNTMPWGLNNLDQVVGNTYHNDFSVISGFLAQPGEK